VETDRGALGYDVLLVATGARREPAVEGAVTFDGARGVAELRDVLARAVAGEVRRIAFVVPDGVAWPLPLYELALLTEVHLLERGARTRLDIVTPEAEPLGLFGAPASERIGRALAARGIAVRRPEDLDRLRPDAIVALPRIAGPRLPGLPWDDDGFIPVDDHGQVTGTDDVYAAGDATDFPVKQGGLATQQAAAAAAHIAHRAGAPGDPRPFAPALHALLLTGAVPLYLHGGPGPEAMPRPLWPAATKVIGTRLARRLGIDEPGERPEGAELAFMLADEEAARGNAGAALEWLMAAEVITGSLPAAYADKRLAWTLGGPSVRQSHA
jgi:sulfide:quinone oxidoreductase